MHWIAVFMLVLKFWQLVGNLHRGSAQSAVCFQSQTEAKTCLLAKFLFLRPGESLLLCEVCRALSSIFSCKPFYTLSSTVPEKWLKKKKNPPFFLRIHLSCHGLLKTSCVVRNKILLLKQACLSLRAMLTWLILHKSSLSLLSNLFSQILGTGVLFFYLQACEISRLRIYLAALIPHNLIYPAALSDD